MRARRALPAVLVLVLSIASHAAALEYVESSSGLVPPSMEGGHTELEFADINADGDVDILSIGDHGSPYVNTDQHGIMVWFGDGTGTWSVFQNGNFGYGGIAVGDVNDDGLLDVGYGMHHNYSGTDFGDQLIEVALGDGTGMNWTPWDDGLATNGETWGMFGTDFADVDNDGDLDLGSNSFGCCAGVHVYLNHEDGTWTQSWGFVGGNSDMSLVFGDVNNDGNVDLAARNQEGTVYFGDGEGNFANADGNLPDYSWKGTALGDVDNDGGVDLSCTTGYPDEGVAVWVWDDDAEEWVDFSGTLPATGGYGATQLFDMNADGFVDLCAFGDGLFTVWLGDGAGNWTEDATFTTPPPGYCEALRVGWDVDNNGFPDVALLDEEGSWPSYQNHLRCYRETSVPESLTIFPIFPRGDETLSQGSVQFIDWVSAVPGAAESAVTLEYSTTGDGGPWIPIAADLPNNGRQQWTLPRANSTDCYIRYTVATGREIASATTAAAFTILGDDTGIAGEQGGDARMSLSIHPNPTRSGTTIRYTLGSPSTVRLAVYDVAGRLVSTLVDSEMQGPGEHERSWDGLDAGGRRVAAGVYFCRLEAAGETVVAKVVVAK
jgi:hypothetical protein